MTEQQRQNILDLPKVIAGAVASPSAAVLTSRFGVAGTFVGLALSAVIVTVISDILKVYLARAPGAVTKIEGGFTKKPRWHRPFHILRQPFSKFASLAPANRRSILFGSLIAGGIAFLVGLVVVTGLELSAGKDLSCWVWNDCPTASSTDGETSSSTSTLPSILGGGRSTGNNVLPFAPSNPQQQQAPGAPAPSQTPGVSGSQNANNPSQPQPGQRQSPSGVPENQQQNPSGENQQQYPSSTLEDQPQSFSSNPEDQQQSSSSTSEDQQQDYFSNAPESQQRSPADSSSKGQKQQNPAPPASQGGNNR